MSWPVAFFILLGVAATTAAVTWPEPEPSEWTTTALCEKIASMSAEEFGIWIRPQSIYDVKLTRVLTCILKEARE